MTLAGAIRGTENQRKITQSELFSENPCFLITDEDSPPQAAGYLVLEKA